MSLAREVLARTSGPACAAAGPLLPALVDGSIERTERSLVEAHLTRCPACRGELGHVRDLVAFLPLAAAVEPDAGFLGDVLARTSALHAGGAAATRWTRLALRPRFAFEVAYVAVVLMSVIFTLADVNLRTVPGKVRTVMTTLLEEHP